MSWKALQSQGFDSSSSDASDEESTTEEESTSDEDSDSDYPNIEEAFQLQSPSKPSQEAHGHSSKSLPIPPSFSFLHRPPIRQAVKRKLADREPPPSDNQLPFKSRSRSGRRRGATWSDDEKHKLNTLYYQYKKAGRHYIWLFFLFFLVLLHTYSVSAYTFQ